MKTPVHVRIVLLVLLGASGCATVKPWERGQLVERCMRTSLDRIESSRDGHVHATREAMEGASVGGGASCGCN